MLWSVIAPSYHHVHKDCLKRSIIKIITSRIELISIKSHPNIKNTKNHPNLLNHLENLIFIVINYANLCHTAPMTAKGYNRIEITTNTVIPNNPIGIYKIKLINPFSF